uniref:hypothetical protein n=1 Tax=Pedobacter schmidteae TaxID=2201271 RepID=UPI000EAF5558|nr:hypothetical protein [Pedobacter schmidteae]
MKKMKKVINLMFAFTLVVWFSPKTAHAQMGEAQQVQWDVTKVADLKFDQESMWDLLSQLDMVALYTKGYVKSVEIKGTEPQFERVLTFVDGTSRTEKFEQIEQEHKFLAYSFAKNSLPTDIQEVSICVFTKAKGKETEVKWVAKITGKDEAKKALVAKLNAEFGKYVAGLTTVIENSVPATVME